VGVKAANAGIKGGACKAIKMHDTLPKQVSVRFNSTIVSAKRRYRALSRITCGHVSATLEVLQMNTVKTITFTKTMIDKGVKAIDAAQSAEALKLKFFKSIKGRVPRDQIMQATPAFQSVAHAYYDKQHNLNGALIEAVIEGKLKETTKLGALTIRQHKDNIRKMAVRWRKYYAKWLDTNEIGKVGGKAGPKKRTTKGAVSSGKAGKKDTVSLNPPETTPLKKTIEIVSSVNSAILKEVKWSACREGLRQEIEIAALEFVVLLNEIK
jgi:hypothetical protein